MAEVVENPLAKRGPGRPTKKIEVTKVVNKPVEKVSEKPVPEVDDNDEVKLTGKELKALKALLSDTATTANTTSQNNLVEALVQALRESRKPYKSEAELENERKQQDQMRKTAKRNAESDERRRAYCKHMAGTNELSDVPHPANAFTSIVWHDITNQLRWGICTICQRDFWPTDKDYRYWRNKRSFNQASSAGQRDGVDTQTWIAEQHPEPFGSRTGIDPREVIQREHAIQF